MQEKEKTTTLELAAFVAKLLMIYDEHLDEGDATYLLTEYLEDHGICDQHLEALVRELDSSKVIPLTHEIH